VDFLAFTVPQSAVPAVAELLQINAPNQSNTDVHPTHDILEILVSVFVAWVSYC